MRTMTQMVFETSIQFALQIRMLVYFKDNLDQAAEFGVNINSILISLLLAVVHILMELFSLSIEAQACKLAFFEYCITCLNGCIGFVPII